MASPVSTSPAPIDDEVPPSYDECVNGRPSRPMPPSGSATSYPGGDDDDLFRSWAPLLDQAGEYAETQGWRFQLSSFMKVPDVSQIPDKSESTRLTSAHAKALPTALDFGERVAKATKQLPYMAPGAEGLVSEFNLCQRLCSIEAVRNSMVASCKALEIYPESASGDKNDISYQDTSAPLRVIAQRLRNQEQHDHDHNLREVKLRRLKLATFIVEFGLAYGLPEKEDKTAMDMTNAFLDRVKEFECDPKRKSEVLTETMRTMPMSLKASMERWLEKNKDVLMVGGVIIGGVVGLAAAIGVGFVASAFGGGRRRRM